MLMFGPRSRSADASHLLVGSTRKYWVRIGRARTRCSCLERTKRTSSMTCRRRCARVCSSCLRGRYARRSMPRSARERYRGERYRGERSRRLSRAGFNNSTLLMLPPAPLALNRSAHCVCVKLSDPALCYLNHLQRSFFRDALIIVHIPSLRRPHGGKTTQCCFLNTCTRYCTT